VDPDSEIVTATKLTPGNAGDASVAAELIDDLLGEDEAQPPTTGQPDDAAEADPRMVYGDSAYGGGEFQSTL
jgi:hypothetical protein